MGKGNDSRHGRRKPAPISTHPAFATLVALWFAALFGLGSLIPSIDPLARLLGLQAASPLTQLLLKIALAAFAGLIGFLLGSSIAQLVARGQARSADAESGTTHMPTIRDVEAEAARRPIIAHEELGMEGLGPVPQDAWGDLPNERAHSEEPVPPERFDSPWLADEDGHIWSEELADAPLALTAHDILPGNTTPVVPERPLAELGMVELIERLAHAIQNKHGLTLTRTLPDNAVDRVRRLDAEVQANNTAYASFKDIEALSQTVKPGKASTPVPAPPASTPAAAEAIFPDSGARRRRSRASARDESPIGEDDREGDALRSALETLRRMSGTA